MPCVVEFAAAAHEYRSCGTPSFRDVAAAVVVFVVLARVCVRVCVRAIVCVCVCVCVCAVKFCCDVDCMRANVARISMRRLGHWLVVVVVVVVCVGIASWCVLTCCIRVLLCMSMRPCVSVPCAPGCGARAPGTIGLLGMKVRRPWREHR